MAFAVGYTMASRLNLDPLGWLYISIATFWTMILCMGITFLISKRHLPSLRIRNVPLTVSAVATLHVYWVLCLIAYVLQGFFPCSTEYWIMSVYLPLGIALFQASNTQLLHIANVQRKYTRDQDFAENTMRCPRGIGWRRSLTSLHAENRVKRAMAFIACGMSIQVVIAMAVFLLSRKFHSDFGLIGPKPEIFLDGSPQCIDLELQYLHSTQAPEGISACGAAQKIACRRGWEWIPSILWQFVWSWCYAPYLLWEVRGIHDVHGWRKQTTFCCLSGLFATPMWLCALYVQEMHVVNRYYVPPLWFAPSIFLTEAFLIFVPCWQVLKNNRLQSETLDIIAEWECKNNGSSIGGETMQSSSKSSRKPSTTSTTGSRRGEIYTMTALESAIRTNPQPLLLFASLKDFSGENISFLTKILDWKRGWLPSSPAAKSGFLRRPSMHETNNKVLQRQQFKHAVDIYTSYVSLRYSNYPINLSHIHFKELEAIFGSAATILYGHQFEEFCDCSNSATPFENFSSNFRIFRNSSIQVGEDIESGPGRQNHTASTHDSFSIHSQASTHHTLATSDTADLIQQAASSRPTTTRQNHLCSNKDAGKHAALFQTYELTTANPTPISSNTSSSIQVTEVVLPDNTPIPRGFGPEVFDRAEESIKYMVLTNTWSKFVNAGYAAASAGGPDGDGNKRGRGRPWSFAIVLPSWRREHNGKTTASSIFH